MNIKILIPILFGITLLSSCKTPKDISYFQDVKSGSSIYVGAPNQVKVQPGDKLRVIVCTQDEKLTDMFNLRFNRNSGGNNSGDNPLGYIVMPDGNIDFPTLGMQKVSGFTRDQIAIRLKEELQKRDLVKNPVVVVDYMNLGVSVLGDVKSPGFYNIRNDRYTVLEAIADAGDLNITGNRKNVTVIRQEVGSQKVYKLDLLDAKGLFTSPAFFLQQNDVIYIEPNDKRKRETTSNGNKPMTYGFWISIASFLMTVASFTVRLK